MKTLNRLAAGTLVVHMMAACGGGNSGEGGATDTSTEARITNTNAEQVASLVVETSNGIQELGGMGSSLTGGSLTRGVNTNSLEVSALSLSSLVMQPADGKLETVKLGPETEQCPLSGSITISADVQNPNSETPTPGDSLTMTADQCGSVDGVLDGGISLVISSFKGDVSSFPFEFSATLTLNNFNVTEGSEIATAHGDMTLAIASDDGITTTSALGGKRISVSYDEKTHALSAFNFSHAADTATGAYTRFSNGTVDGSQLGGTVTFRTLVPFQGLGDEYPHAGEMSIKGAGNSAIRLIALDSLNVRLEIDITGDGNFETTIDTTWETIDS